MPTAMDEIPITTRKARIALWTVLAISLTALAFSLVNFGLTSIFIGLCAACTSIIHVSIHLIIIRLQEKRASRAGASIDASGGTQTKRPTNTGVLPPTSTLPSIIFACIYAMAFITGFIFSTLILALGSSLFAFEDFTRVVIPFEIAFEILSAIALVCLVVIGIKERKEFLEITRRIRLEDIPSA